MTEARSADYMAKTILSDPTMLSELKQDPQTVLRQAAATATIAIPGPNSDKVVYRMVVGFLGGVLIIVAIGLILLSYKGGNSTPPEGLIALGSAAVGALAGLLAPAPSR